MVHAFRNTLNPYITSSADLFAGLFSGSLILEIIFSYPGIGRLMYEAVRQEDINLVLANIHVHQFSDPAGHDRGRRSCWRWSTRASVIPAAVMAEAAARVGRGTVLWRRLRARPVAAASVLVLALLYGAMLLAEFLAPYAPTTVFRFHTHQPPTLGFHSRELGFGPQVQHRVLVDEVTRRYARIRGQHYRVRLLVRGEPYRLWGLVPLRVHLFGTTAPYVDAEGATVRAAAGTDPWQGTGQAYPVFLLGSDHLGRDIFSRILYGSRISLTIGFIGISISLSLAIVLGGVGRLLRRGGGLDPSCAWPSCSY